MATTEDGTALAGKDYQAFTGRVTIPPGQSRVAVAVKLLDNDVVGPYAKQFRAVLADPRSAKLGRAGAVCRVLDDDLPPLPVGRGLVLHLDASLAGDHADGDAVDVWRDVSGQGHHAVPEGTKPTWLEKGIGELPAVDFDGNGMGLVVAPIRKEAGPVSVYVVSARGDAEGAPWQRLVACANGAANDWTPPNWCINAPREEGGGPRAYGARVDALRSQDGRGIGAIRVGRQGTTTGGRFRGRIGEVLVYDCWLADEEDAKVQAWLRAKCGIAP